MTLPSIVRVFFAIGLPPAVSTRVEQLIGDLKKKAKTHDIRWTKPENLHITLHFLAEVRSVDLPQLVAHVRRQTEGALPPFSLTLGALRVFPNPYRPRVIVLDLSTETALTQLAEKVRLGIQAAQYPIEDRPFRGHLTLGRIKHAPGIQLKFLTACPLPAFDSFTVSEMVLFRSEPQPAGSQYTVLERIGLQMPLARNA